MLRVGTCVVAALIASFSLAAADTEGNPLAALEKKLTGSWEGTGPCDGRLILNTNGTYEWKLHGPGGNNSSGTWKLRWDALPPTLTLDCIQSDAADNVGRLGQCKVVRLDDARLSIKYENSPSRTVFKRTTRSE